MMLSAVTFKRGDVVAVDMSARRDADGKGLR
jgi:hypothetical protein